MHLTEILKPDMVWPRLAARTKAEVIKELSERIALGAGDLNAETVSHVLMERERLGSTGIQDGIAIPHGKVPGLNRIVMACGLSPEGVDFDSHDGRPTRIFFVLLAPESAAGEHLKALAKLSRILKDPDFRSRMIASGDQEALYGVISEEDRRR